MPRAAYAAAYLAGLAVHLVGMSWVLDCYRYDNLWGPYLLQWFWIGTYGGVLFAITLAAGRRLVRQSAVPLTLLLPSLWTVMEYVRHATAGFVIGIDFPWLKLGMALEEYPRLFQVADLGGEFLLTLLVSMINGALLDLILIGRRNRSVTWKWHLACPVAALLLFASASGYGQWRLGQTAFATGPTVCLLGELDLPPILPSERLQTAFQAQGQSGHADLLVWPELAYHHAIVDTECGATAVSSDDQARDHLIRTARDLKATLVIGCEHRVKGGESSVRYNSVACVGPVEGYQGCYDKRYLVPTAETVSTAGDGLPYYTHGNSDCVFRVVTPTGVRTFGTAICYDLCFSKHFRDIRKNKAVDFFVQSGAEGQDHNDVVAERMLSFARLRAIENRRPLVRNATLGYSALIDGNGTVRQSLPPEPIDSPIWFGAIPLDDRTSLYTTAGDWPASMCCATIAILALLTRHHDG